MKEQKLILRCPQCNSYLYYDPGQQQTFYEPMQPSVIYCKQCGYEREPDKRDINMIKSEWSN